MSHETVAEPAPATDAGTTTDMRQLARIPAPNVALAIFTQYCTSRQIKSPRHFDPAHTTIIERQPARVASLVTKQLWRGFKSVHCVCTPEAPDEVFSFFESETAELCASGSAHTARVDGCLPARHASVALLVHGQCCTSTSAMQIVDAFASIGAMPVKTPVRSDGQFVQLVRMSILSGDDADWYAQQIRPVASCSSAQADASTVQLAVRWLDQSVIRGEFFNLNNLGTKDTIATGIQNVLARVREMHSVPIPVVIFTPVHAQTPNTWAETHRRASDTFFSMMTTADPAPAQRKLLIDELGAQTLDDLNIWVRIVQRGLPDNDASAFHAMLLGDARYGHQIRAYCRDNTRLEAPPENVRRQWQLATCATHAAVRPLGHLVTVFAPNCGRIGQSYRVPGSWMWETQTATVPLHMLPKNFDIYPCADESIYPDNSYRDAFCQSIHLTTAHHLLLNGNATEAEAPEPPRPPVTDYGDPDVIRSERFMRAAFGFDVTSRRQTVGDCYALLQQHGGPEELRDFMLEQTLRFGVQTSLVDALRNTTHVLRRLKTPPSTASMLDRAEKRTLRLLGAAMEHGAKRRRGASSPAAVDPVRVNRVLKMLCMRVNFKYTINKHVNTEDIVQLVQHMVANAATVDQIVQNIDVYGVCKIVTIAIQKTPTLEAVHAALVTLTQTLPDLAKGTAPNVYALWYENNKAKTWHYGERGCVQVTIGSLVDDPSYALLVLKKNMVYALERQPVDTLKSAAVGEAASFHLETHQGDTPLS
jgi:hypothetical protein